MRTNELETKLKEIMRPTKELEHGEDTVKWLLRIEPEACWQLQIAALAHDIERAVPDIPDMTPPKPTKSNIESYDEYKQKHAQRSAAIVSHLMSGMRFSTNDVSHVTNAITKHEVGGDPDSNLVRDADSIRWFDSGYKHYIDKYGLGGAKEKGLWMYKRAAKKTKKLIDSLDYDVEIRAYIEKLTT